MLQPRSKATLWACAIALCGMPVTGGASKSGYTRSSGSSHGVAVAAKAPAQKIAIPSYFYPGSSYWTRLDSGVPTVSIAIINPNSGPATSPDCSNADQNYVRQVKTSEAAGVTVLGYVDTNYTKVPIGTAKTNADIYYHCYKVDGIFFDNATTSCESLPYYKSLYAHVTATFQHHVVVINPGTQTNKCYLAAANIIVTFESAYSAYLSGFSTPAWVRKTPAKRFWHLVYDTGTIQEMRNAIRLSKKRHAGYVYVTPDNLPNPWDTLPNKPYWQAELQAAK